MMALRETAALWRRKREEAGARAITRGLRLTGRRRFGLRAGGRATQETKTGLALRRAAEKLLLGSGCGCHSRREGGWGERVRAPLAMHSGESIMTLDWTHPRGTTDAPHDQLMPRS